MIGHNGWPCRLVADKQDELQLVLDHLRNGNLNLRDYLMEMYERASMYFHQIGLAQCPPQRVQHIQSLHQQAQQVRLCHVPTVTLHHVRLFNPTESTSNIGPLQTLYRDLRPQQITLPDPTNMFKWPNVLCCYGTTVAAPNGVPLVGSAGCHCSGRSSTVFAAV